MPGYEMGSRGPVEGDSRRTPSAPLLRLSSRNFYFCPNYLLYRYQGSLGDLAFSGQLAISDKTRSPGGLTGIGGWIRTDGEERIRWGTDHDGEKNSDEIFIHLRMVQGGWMDAETGLWLLRAAACPIRTHLATPHRHHQATPSSVVVVVSSFSRLDIIAHHRPPRLKSPSFSLLLCPALLPSLPSPPSPPLPPRECVQFPPFSCIPSASRQPFRRCPSAACCCPIHPSPAAAITILGVYNRIYPHQPHLPLSASRFLPPSIPDR